MRSKYHLFRRSICDVASVQKKYLEKLIKVNNNTLFGKKYGFRNIDSIEQFQQTLPLSTFDDYLSYIDKIAEGQSNVLTSDKVRLFEPSSGSTSASKLIPYNNTLKNEFNQSIGPWMFALYRNNPQLFKGKAYWSISPSMYKDKLKGKIRIGFDDDSQYLGFLGKHLYDKIIVVPASICKETDIDSFRNKTLAHLLLCENLVLISVWNPTFLILLLEHCLQNEFQVLEYIKIIGSGKYSKRVEQIASLLSGNPQKNVFKEIWPDLSVLSCWTDGTSKYNSKKLSEYLPDTKIQGKGLISTEAFVSFPFDEKYDPILAVNSHFFEFIDEENEQIYLAHELEKGKTYSVVVTTGGGLYRYKLEDIIEVTGFYESAPTLRFISKANHISDHAGEKLNERHVQSCFERVFIEYDIKPEFFLLAPIECENNGISYCLFLEDNKLPQERYSDFLDCFEDKLCENFHYKYCRKLGQLDMPKLFKIKTKGTKIYHNQFYSRGLRTGDIKDSCLAKDIGWEKIFPGMFCR